MSEHDARRSMAVGRTALDQIAALGLAADPATYAVWYAYGAAQHPEISRRLDELLAGNARLSAADVRQIWDDHLSPVGSLARIENVQNGLASEVDQIVDLIEAAMVGLGNYRAELDGACSGLERPADRETVGAIVRALLQSTKAAEERSRELETRLRAARQEIDDLRRDLDRISLESTRDQLTSLFNRKHFDVLLRKAIAHATVARTTFCVLLIDIDYFKRVNDTHGHQAGDEVLRLLAHTLTKLLNGDDVAARYGGDEFVALLPNIDSNGAKDIAESFRAAITGKIVRRRSTNEELGRLTVSIGLAEFMHGDEPDGLVARADTALYRAKRQGRNRLGWQAAGADTSLAPALAENLEASLPSPG